MNAPTTTSQMPKRLPFEPESLRIESHLCERCAGTGQITLGRMCWNCYSSGRIFTTPGKLVLLEVCAMIGIQDPLDQGRDRWHVSDTLPTFARDVRPGMQISVAIPGGPGPRDGKSQVVTAAVDTGLSVRLHFANDEILIVGREAVFSRDLTDYEKDRAAVFMSGAIGNGVVKV